MKRHQWLVAGLVAVVAFPTLQGQVVHADCGASGGVNLEQTSVTIEAGTDCDGEPGPAPKPPKPLTPSEKWIALGCEGLTGQPYTGPREADDGSQIPGATMNGPAKLDRVTEASKIVAKGWDLTAEYSNYRTVCTTGEVIPVEVWITEIYADTDPVPIEDLRKRAIDSLAPPEPAVQTNPAHDRADRHGWVQIPTWLWTTNALESDGEAQVAGFITVTAKATAVSTIWDMGDGSPPITCIGPGVEWRPGIAEDQTDCSHTYTRSSGSEPNREYRASAETTWDITWAQNGADQGNAGTITTNADFTMPIWQIQAVNTGG